MSKKLIIANWKMNLSIKDSKRLTRNLISYIRKIPQGVRGNFPEVVLCPSFSALSDVGQAIASSKGAMRLGAQDCFWSTQGAFTGEESPLFLKELGVEYIIIGHSERRMYLGETNEMISKKIQSCIAEKSLVPVLCVGEKKEERAVRDRERVISSQILSAISLIRELKPKRPFVIAYEPVWAIGTGTPCTPADCATIYSFIQDLLISHLGRAYTKKWCRILYGGSVSAKNINGFVSKGVSDGSLVGGASLNARDFYIMIRSIL